MVRRMVRSRKRSKERRRPLSAQNTDRSLVPTLLERALRQIETIRLFSAEAAAYHRPAIGAIGGAGKPIPVTRIVLVLDGIDAASSERLKRAAQKNPGSLSWTIHDDQNGKRQPLKWRISRYNPRHLILVIRGSVRVPRRLTAVITDSTTTAQWRIVNAS